jgi:truncated hemoglobin YjbI
MRDRWLAHMNAALDAVMGDVASPAVPPDVIVEMRDYFVRAADHLRNV